MSKASQSATRAVFLHLDEDLSLPEILGASLRKLMPLARVVQLSDTPGAGTAVR
jgi:hypothetical protein